MSLFEVTVPNRGKYQSVYLRIMIFIKIQDGLLLF